MKKLLLLASAILTASLCGCASSGTTPGVTTPTTPSTPGTTIPGTSLVPATPVIDEYTPYRNFMEKLLENNFTFIFDTIVSKVDGTYIISYNEAPTLPWFTARLETITPDQNGEYEHYFLDSDTNKWEQVANITSSSLGYAQSIMYDITDLTPVGDGVYEYTEQVWTGTKDVTYLYVITIDEDNLEGEMVTYRDGEYTDTHKYWDLGTTVIEELDPSYF